MGPCSPLWRWASARTRALSQRAVLRRAACITDVPFSFSVGLNADDTVSYVRVWVHGPLRGNDKLTMHSPLILVILSAILLVAGSGASQGITNATPIGPSSTVNGTISPDFATDAYIRPAQDFTSLLIHVSTGSLRDATTDLVAADRTSVVASVSTVEPITHRLRRFARAATRHSTS